MQFNKNKFNKVNDKKVLHKIGKKWVTISVGILAAIGLAGATTAASANTNTMIDHPAMVGHLSPAQRAANRAKRRANGGNNPLNNQIKNNNNARKNGTTPADIAHKHPALNPAQKNKIGQENAAKLRAPQIKKHVRMHRTSPRLTVWHVPMFKHLLLLVRLQQALLMP